MERLRFLVKTVCALAAGLALVLQAPAALVRVHAGAAGMAILDQGTPDKNLSADAVGKLLVNFADGAVSAKGRTVAVLRLPEALFGAGRGRLARADLVFSVAGAKNWDPAVFTPVLAPLAEPYEPAEATWNQAADGVAWSSEGAGVLGAGVPGVYRPQGGTLVFDLLPLLADSDAAAALAANGAAVRLAWDELPEAEGYAMLRLNTTASGSVPDAYFVLDADTASLETGLPAAYAIDESKPDFNAFSDNIRFIMNAPGDPQKGDTRVLAALPDLDLPTVLSLDSLHFAANLNWKGSDPAGLPAFANVLTTPFGTTAGTAATWNCSDVSTSNAWSGGAFDDSLALPVAFGESSVDVDLSALLGSGLRDAAFANGLILRWDTSARGQIAGTHVVHTLFRDGPAPELVWTQRPVTHSYIDSGKPDANFGWSGATLGKCIAVFNPGGGESRVLLKFAPSFFDFDPAQQAALVLDFPYWKEWPAEEDAGEDNTLVLNPLAAPFRMDQATWNAAANGAPWTAPGGDFDASRAVAAAIDRDAKVASFDLTALFRDPDALAVLRDNGAVVRLGNAGHPVGTGSIGFNLFGAAPEAGIAGTDGGAPVFRAVAATAGSGENPGTRTLDLTGLDPLADYELWTCTDLTAGPDAWTYDRDVPDSGLVTLDATDGPAFYRVQLRRE